MINDSAVNEACYICECMSKITNFRPYIVTFMNRQIVTDIIKKDKLWPLMKNKIRENITKDDREKELKNKTEQMTEVKTCSFGGWEVSKQNKYTIGAKMWERQKLALQPKGIHKTYIEIVHTNIKDLSSKLLELDTMNYINKPNVICITQSKLNPFMGDVTLVLRDYNI